MRFAKAISATVALAATVVGSATVPPAVADDGYAKYAMNGRFSVVSNGEWATMNDRYQDEPSVRSEWTVNTTCTTALTCSGKVTSTLGWTEDIYTGTGNTWYVKHYVQDWIPCPDGTTGPGLQVYKIYPSNDEGISQRPSDLWLGEDLTTGQSGACGRNKSLVLALPVKITKIG